MAFRLPVAFFFSALLSAVPAPARQVVDSTTVRAAGRDSSAVLRTVGLPGIEVVATSARSATDGLRLLRFDRADLIAASLVDRLALSGLYLRTDGTGMPATLSARGLHDLQTGVRLEAFDLRDPLTGTVDPAAVPRVALEGATVAFGPAAGAGAGLGGLVTLRLPSSCIRARGDASVGSFGSRSAGLAGGLPTTIGCLLFAGQVDSEQADYPVEPVAHGPERRAGNDRRRRIGLVVWRGAAGALRWSTSVHALRRVAGLPGPANAAPRGARLLTAQDRFSARIERVGTGTVWSLEAQVHSQSGRFLAYSGASPVASAARAVSATASITRRLSGTGYVEATLTSGHHRMIAGGRGAARDAMATVSIGRGQRPLTAALTLVVGSWPDLAVHLAPRAVVGLRVGSFGFSTSGGWAARPPTVAERYWVPGGRPDLAPERGLSAEARIDWLPRFLVHGSVSVFATRQVDRIVWQPRLVAPGVDVWSPSNVGRSVSRGAEFHLSAGETHGVSLTAGLTLQRALDRSDPLAASYGHSLRFTPEALGTVDAAVTRGPWSTRAAVRYVGRQATASDGSRFLRAHSVIDWSIARSLGRGSVRCTLYNALDRRYSAQPQYPMPGRHVACTLHFDLDR